METALTYGLINEVFLLGDDIDRQILNQFSLTVRQYHLLNWLHVRNQASLTELAQLLLCDKSNVTGIIRRLKKAEFIQELPKAKSDRRFTTVRLTEAGRAVHQQASAALKYSVNKRFETVSESQHEELQRLLREMKRHLRNYIDTCLPAVISELTDNLEPEPPK